MFDVSVQVLDPAGEFRFPLMKGQAIDISLSGMRLQINDLSRELYARLISKVRYARLALFDPQQDEEIELMGRLVWFVYQNNRASDPSGKCSLGIALDKSDGKQPLAYSRFVDRIAAVQA